MATNNPDATCFGTLCNNEACPVHGAQWNYPGVGTCQCMGDESAPCDDPECINTATEPIDVDAVRKFVHRVTELGADRDYILKGK